MKFSEPALNKLLQGQNQSLSIILLPKTIQSIGLLQTWFFSPTILFQRQDEKRICSKKKKKVTQLHLHLEASFICLLKSHSLVFVMWLICSAPNNMVLPFLEAVNKAPSSCCLIWAKLCTSCLEPSREEKTNHNLTTHILGTFIPSLSFSNPQESV